MFVFLLAAIVSHAENSFTADAVSIQPGEEQTIVVTLTNDDLSKSAAIDITLPEGLSFVGDDGSVVFTSRADGMSSKAAKIQTSGALRVGLVFGTIAAGSGELFSFKVKAADNAQLGTYKMKFSNMALTGSASNKISIADSEVSVTVYDTAGISGPNGQQAVSTISVYDLSGRLLYRDIPVCNCRQKLSTGVYVINGRAVMVK